MRNVVLLVSLVSSCFLTPASGADMGNQRLTPERLREVASQNADMRLKAYASKIKYVALMDVCGKADIGDRLYRSIPVDAGVIREGTPEDKALVQLLSDTYLKGVYIGLREGWETVIAIPNTKEAVCSSGTLRAIELTRQK